MREVRVQGLAPNKEYRVQVRSLGVGGASTWSSPLSIVTDNIPGVSDGDAPTGAPVISFLGGLRSVFVFFDGVTNADPITYEYHVGTTPGFVADASSLLAESDATLMSFNSLPNGDPMVYDVTYYFRVIAKDADGEGPESNEVSGRLDRTATGDIVAGSITAEKLAAELVLASTITTATAGSRVEMSPSGFRAYDSTGAPIFLIPTDPDTDAFFKGNFIARSLTVEDKLTIQGLQNEIAAGSTLTLGNGITAPNAGPTVSQYLPTYLINAAAAPPIFNQNFGGVGYKRASNGNWYGLVKTSTGTYHIVRNAGNNTGNLSDYQLLQQLTESFGLVTSSVKTLFDFCLDDNNMYVLMSGSFTNELSIFKIPFSSMTGSSASVSEFYTARPGTKADFKIFYDGVTASTAKIGIARSHTNNASVNIDMYNLSGSGGGVSASSSILLDDSNAAALGEVNFDSSGLRSIFRNLPDVGDGYLIGATAIGKKAIYFTSSGIKNNSGGFSYDASTTGIEGTLSYDSIQDRVIVSSWYKITPMSKMNPTYFSTGSSKFNAAYSWFDSNASGGQHETLVSPISMTNILKRHFAQVTTASVPFGAGGPDLPDKVRIYVYNTSGSGFNLSDMRRKSTELPNLATTDIFESIPTGTLAPNTGTPPAFVATDAASIKTNIGGMQLFGNGLGQWPNALEHSNYCYTYLASAASIPSGTLTKVPLAVYAQSGGALLWDSTNNVMEVKIAGRYKVEGTVTFAASSGGSRRVAFIGKSTSRTTAASSMNRLSYSENNHAGATGQPSVTATAEEFLNVGDFISLNCFQDSGGALNTRAGDINNKYVRFTANYLGSV